MNDNQTVYVVDDDEGVRDGLSLLLATVGQPCELYESGHDFLEAYDNERRGCLVLDIRMPRMTGLDAGQTHRNGFDPADHLHHRAW
jgi:two-component system response regulator FixJ